VHRADVGHRRHSPGANRPDRLVSDGNLRRSALAAGQRAVELGGDHRFGLTGIALCLGLSHADNCPDSGSERCLGLGFDQGVALTMHGAAFGMANNRKPGAGIGQHRRGDVAGEGAGGLGVAILAANRGSFEGFGQGLDQGERRRDPDLNPGMARRAAINRAGLGQHRAGSVHFPVADDIGRIGHGLPR
jgi:hypothetical protein